MRNVNISILSLHSLCYSKHTGFSDYTFPIAIPHINIIV